MKIGKFLIEGNWGHIAFVSMLVGYMAWYFFDAVSASANISNLLLILPVTVTALILYVVLIITEIKISKTGRKEPSPTTQIKDKISQKVLLKKWIYAGAMALFLVLIPIIGFELSCFLFMSGMLRLLGAQSWTLFILYPFIFSIGISYIFIMLLHVPLRSLCF